MSLPRDKIRHGKTYRRGNVLRTVVDFPQDGRAVRFTSSNGRSGMVWLQSFARWATEEVGEPTTCRWEYDRLNDEYFTECSTVFILPEGTPSDNQYNFCPSCGKPIEVTR